MSAPTPAVARAAAILTRLADQPARAVGPSELSRAVGVPKSTVLNLCAALVQARLVRRVDGGYQLGSRLAELGHAYLAGVTEVEVFHRLCRERYPDAPWTVQLAVLGDGPSAVFLARHDGTEPLNLGLAAEIGRAVPAHCTACGKALLAALDERDLDARLAGADLRAATASSLSTPDALRAELRAVAERGWADDGDEIVDGLSCIGVAVRTPRRIDGLVAISFTFTRRSAPADEPAAAAGLREFAGTFAERIGGEPAWTPRGRP